MKVHFLVCMKCETEWDAEEIPTLCPHCGSESSDLILDGTIHFAHFQETLTDIPSSL